MGLKEILSEVDDCNKIINQDLSQVNLKARTYKTGQIKSAQTRLEGLKDTYKQALRESSVAILVTGKKAEDFAKLSEEKFNCFVVDGKSFYRDAIGKLSPQLYLNKSINSSVFEVLGNIVEDRMHELDILEYNSLIFEAKYSRVVKSEDEMVDIAALAVNDTIGPAIVGLDALDKVSKQALESQYKSRIVPIVIYSDDESFIQSISDDMSKLSPRFVTVSAGDIESVDSQFKLKTISEASVGKTLKQIASNA